MSLFTVCSAVSQVRNDLVAFLPLSSAIAHTEPKDTTGSPLAPDPSAGDDDGNVDTCPPAIMGCFQRLIGLASVSGLATAVTGGAPLLVPPLGMVAVYDANGAQYVPNPAVT